jgi:hypothetical protein
MSAQYGATSVLRPDIARPPFSRAGGRRPPDANRGVGARRRPLLVAAATLSAPALAVAILAGVGAASGGGDGAGVATLSGSPGLHGATTPAVAQAPQVRAPSDKDKALGQNKATHSKTHRVHSEPTHPSPSAAPKPAPKVGTGIKHIQPPPVPESTTGPGAPGTDPSTLSGSGTGSSTSGLSGTSGSSGTGTSGSDTTSGSYPPGP